MLSRSSRIVFWKRFAKSLGKIMGRFLTALTVGVAAAVWQTAALAVESGNEYLKYQEPVSNSGGISWFSSFAYVFSLLFTFAVVLLLAYMASRFLGRRLGHLGANGGRKQQILQVIPLGQQGAIQVVEVGGRILVLGITSQQIQLLLEITDPQEMDRIRSQQDALLQDELFSEIPLNNMLTNSLQRLDALKNKFPRVFDQSRK